MIEEIESENRLVEYIAHEIKNPLALIKASAQLLEINIKEIVRNSNMVVGEKIGEESLSSIKMMHRQIEKINSLLLDFLNIENAKNRSFDEFDFTKLLKEVISEFSNSYKHIKFVLEADDSIPFVGDFKAITQMISNLLKNGIEAIEGEGVIEISLISEDNKPILSIADNGCGMSEETLSRVMEGYYSSKPNGSGIGIAFCREVIRRHNCEMRIHSKSCVGTKIEICFPARST